ncbi:beta-lactamase/transpeptidase-like protein [Penicillium hispanicum]|uniref:beta-lactamase/transpeptidase-like protein n=1 Tax=Penicillium hispanicum TaxID=1080232 RepID=UPI00254264C6|nr:beta-lactamase/transpeptidase-like protein [Penicillium hispanicum]KAJ5577705.1 beta-lactamase/transpeptidase-like protein [Penicillium hispanicum]
MAIENWCPKQQMQYFKATRMIGPIDPIDDMTDISEHRSEELGASICVNIDGKDIIDIWGGYADEARSRPWHHDTLTAAWSISKVATALAAVTLIDRGLLDPEKVSKYWPEFGTDGKENVKVSHILSHTSGSGYHAINYGHLVGEIVRRISGKSLSQFIADEITGPLRADFCLSLPEQDWPRTADITPPPPMDFGEIDPHSVAARTFTGPPFKAEYSMTPGFRKAEIGGNGGFGSARGIARVGSLVSLQGTVDGKEFLSPASINQMVQERISGLDLVCFQHLRFGFGVGLPVPQITLPWIPEGRLCFWPGWGGSILIMDLDKRTTIAYTANKMGAGILGSERTEAYVRAIYDAANAAA